MVWAVHVAHIHRWKINIKMNLKEIGLGGGGWTGLI
jgi:hypothetical protein